MNLADPLLRELATSRERFLDVVAHVRPEFHPFAEVYPRTLQWLKRIEAVPGYEKTFPAHWRST
jgi:hypothetical protein